jgi:hypothetical protein
VARLTAAASRGSAWCFGALAQWSFGLALAVAAVLAGCGGGGSDEPAITTTSTSSSSSAAGDSQGAPAANVLTLTVDRGPSGAVINTPFVEVTICQPGTDVCRTVDHVLVDTGSNGLRLSAAAVGADLSLPAVANASGTPVGECAQFASGWAWGSVRRADVRLAGERAGNIAIQIVADPAAPFATVPFSCRRTGPNVGVGRLVNGILGVGMQAQDCGSACASSAAPSVYFGCSPAGCASTIVPLASQVSNPVASFAADNNGVILELPAVPPGGIATLSGSLIFGIDTQANNRLGGETVFQTDSRGNFTTTYKGVSYPSSFIDSGSNAIFFPDPAIPECVSFYCPPEILTLSAVNTSATGVSGPVEFRIESVASIAANAAAAHLGGDAGFSSGFDWGLPFFFGRKVFVAMAGAPTSRGRGPFWAY